ncbi:hypothetical protein HY251_14775, partial [bacterium]|nr:hypothetical protein [bacterium]
MFPRSRALQATAVLLVLLAGLVLRARGIEDGLWLDEIGTAWAARGTAADVVRHVEAVQGQSPLPYLIVRATTAALWESEVALRLPSL